MSKECFSCQKNAPKTDIERLRQYKRMYDNKEGSYFFYKESKNDTLKIIDAKEFQTILPILKKKRTSNWAHIADFRDT